MRQQKSFYPRVPQIGDIYMVRFEGIGSEQSGLRPAVVFQNNKGNLHSPNVIVLPLTSVIKKRAQPTHVLLRADQTGLLKDSIVLCENPSCISKQRLQDYITTLPNSYMAQIAEANLVATSALAFVHPSSIPLVRDKSISLNRIVPS